MSVAGSKDCGTTDIDRLPLASDGDAERTGQTEIEPIDARELRTMTPEEIQILAATGC